MITVRNQYWILFFGLFLVNCSNERDSNRIIHPTEENLNPEFGITNIINKRDTLFSNNVPVPDILKRIRNEKTLFTIGKKEGEEYEMFGQISAVHIDENSNIYISDSQDTDIYIYDSNGNHQQTLGRKGRGPGELVNADRIITSNGKIFALDLFFDLKSYRFENGKYVYDSNLETGLIPRSFCISGNELFLQSMPIREQLLTKKPNSITVFRIENYEASLRSFGSHYQSDSPLAVQSMSEGVLACGQKSDQIFQYNRLLNLVYSYDKTGELSWITRLENFQFMRIMETPDRIGVDPNYSQDEYDFIQNLIVLNSDYLLVQIENRKLIGDENQQKTLHSYLLNNDNGSGIYIGNDLYLILSTTEDRLAFLEEDDYPRVRIAEY
jgi:WD40 repeat protein